MQPRGPLMIEHRLIERMLHLISLEASNIRSTRKLNSVFIENAVDFIRVYADQTHHGKEEEILFRDLSKKSMNSDEFKIMEELVQEHILGRKVVGELVSAKNLYLTGDNSAVDTVIEKLELLIDFYPRHIAKEDKVFFPAMMKYLNVDDQQRMLNEFWDFDKNMIHRRYRELIESISKG